MRKVRGVSPLNVAALLRLLAARPRLGGSRGNVSTGGGDLQQGFSEREYG
jgi:hypothetical protein